MTEKLEHSPVPPATPASKNQDPSRRGVQITLLIIGLTLVWYLLADRFTPYTQQARVQAYVVAVAPEVAGRVSQVLVDNNQMVKAGQVLFEINPEPYQIALDKARAELQNMRGQVGASKRGHRRGHRLATRGRSRRAGVTPGSRTAWSVCTAKIKALFPCAAWRSHGPSWSRPPVKSPPLALKYNKPARVKAAAVRTMPACAALLQQSNRPRWT